MPNFNPFIRTGFGKRFSRNLITMCKDAKTEWDPRKVVPKEIEQLLTKKVKNSYNNINVFYQIVSLLKQQERTGWINMDIPKPESIADHMYRMSIIAMSLNTESWQGTKPDLNKCVKIALVHDIAESLVGDIVPHDKKIDKLEKNKREYKTILYLGELVKPYNEFFSKELVDLWLDYEDQRNLEATVVKDIDKFEMLVQTFEYERLHHRRMDEFYACRSVIKNKEIQNIADDLLAERDEFLTQNNL